MVMFTRVFDDDRLSSVSADNAAGGRLAARHLIETGRERIAVIGGWFPASTSRNRKAGFRAGLAEATADGAFDLARTREGIAALFDSPPRRTVLAPVLMPRTSTLAGMGYGG